MKQHFFKKLLICFIILSSKTISAQKIGTDSKGKSIFSFYSLNDYRIEVNTEEPLSLGFSTYRFRTTFTRGADTTIIKKSGIYINLSMLNSGDFINFNTISELNPGVGLKIGWQKSIEKFNDIFRTPSGTYTWGFNGILNFDNIKHYNPSDGLITQKTPYTFGVEGNFTYFSKSKYRNMIAVNASYNRTWNDDDLLNFQSINKTTISNNIVAMKDFEGRYGIFSNNINKYRLSCSLPFYVGTFNPIPYAVFNRTSNISKITLGTFVNILTKKLELKDYSIPSSLGIGVDWTYTNKCWSNPSVFIRGAINFGKFK